MRFLREAECDDGIARVELLTMPRMFGHVFNPVSFHYCYRADGSVRCVVAEVNNTFGERHLYILRRPEGDPARFPLRFPARQAIPRLALQRHARPLRVQPVGDIRAEHADDDRPHARRRESPSRRCCGDAVPLDSRTLLAPLLRHPFRIVSNLPRIAGRRACSTSTASSPSTASPTPPPHDHRRAAALVVQRCMRRVCWRA